MATSQGSSVDVAEQRILALQFVDVIGKKPRHAMRGALGPPRLHVVHLVPKNAFEGRWQLADEFLEELGDVGLKPAGRLVAAGTQEQQ